MSVRQSLFSPQKYLVIDLLVRYFSNATSFQPLFVHPNSGLTSNLNVSAFYAVRFAGLLSVGSADYYTFSYSFPQLQSSNSSSVLLYVDGVELSKPHQDVGQSVLPPSFCFCGSAFCALLPPLFPPHPPSITTACITYN